MTITKNLHTSSVHVILDDGGAFVSAYRVQTQQAFDSTDPDPTKPFAERSRDDQITLAQLKTFVAAL